MTTLPRSRSLSADPDEWLDVVEPHRHHVTRDMLGVPLHRAQRVLKFIATLPGLMSLMVVVVSVALLAAGFSMAQSSHTREQNLTRLINQVEPMSFAAHNLYTSLSVADTAAATGFIEGKIATDDAREQYKRAIAQAGIASARTAAGVRNTDSEEMHLLEIINQQLTEYTGLVETARSHDAAGTSLGSAYLSQASTLMRSEILPNAARLYNLTSTTVAEQQKDLTQPLWVPISGLVAAFVMLLAAQLWLYNRTRRILNKGFAVATVLMFAAIVWVSTANWYTWHSGQEGFTTASEPLARLTNARIIAQQMRTTETLGLARSSSVGDSDTTFEDTMGDVSGALDLYASSPLMNTGEDHAALVRAQSAVSTWEDRHRALEREHLAGHNKEALAVALGDDPLSAASSFDRLDASLSHLINDARDSVRTFLHDGLRAIRVLAVMVIVTSVLSVVLVLVGIRRRLQEFL